MTTEDKNNIITSAVNAHGILLKKAVRKELEKIEGISIIGEEYPVQFGEGAQLDLLVQYKSKNQIYLIIIECKRAYATYKQWVFFQSRENKTKIPYIFDGNNLQAMDGRTFDEIPICIEGIEIDFFKYKKSDDAYKIGSLTRIWETANQVCRGYINFLLSELKSRSKNTQSLPLDNFLVFPLLITTAKLSLCLTQDQNADLKSGNSIDDLSLQEVSCVILNHPYTPSTENTKVFLQLDIEGYQSPIDRGVHAKEGIIILSAENITNFVKSLH